jgi:hypothetical protein
MITGTGLLTGFAGLALAALGLLVALLAGLRLLFLIRKPGKGRVAKGIASAGLVLVICGAVLLAGEELGVLREATDRLVWPLSGIALLLAGFAGVRAGRRRGRVEPLPAPSAGEPAGPGQERPQAGA